MKITKLLFLLCIITLISCGDDPSAEGTWKAQSLDVDGTVTFEFLGQNLTSTYSIVGTDLDYTLHLENPNFTTSGSYTVLAEVNVLGMTQSSTETQDNISGSGTYTIDEMMLITTSPIFSLEIDGEPISTQETNNFTISALTDTEMTLTQTSTESTFDPSVGTIVTNINLTSTWTRQ